MKNGAEVDVRTIGSSDVLRTTSLGYPASGTRAARGEMEVMLPDALTILVERHFQRLIHDIRKTMPSRHSYKS
jgi:hypothetical protein